MADQFLQSASNFNGGAATTTVTLTGVAAGSSLIAFILDGSASNPTTLAVSDSVNGSFTARGAKTGSNSNFVGGQAFSLDNVAAGSHTITGTVSGGAIHLTVVEVTGTFGAANQTTWIAPGTGADAITSGSVAAASASTFIGFTCDSSSTSTSDEPAAGTGYTSRANNANSVIGAWRVESAAGASAAAVTFTAITGSHEFPVFGVSVLNAAPAGAVAQGDMISLNPQRNRPGRGPYSLGVYYRPLTGDTVIAVNKTVALSGIAATSAAGTLGRSTAKAMTGQAGTSAAGTTVQSEAVSLTGSAATASAGTMTTGSDATTALTGQAATSAAGNVSASAAGSASLTGIAATAAAGAGGISHAQGLTGSTATSAAGSVAVQTGQGAALAGSQAATTAGNLAGSVTVGLTGISCSLTAGSVSLTTVLAGSQIVVSQGSMTGSRVVSLLGASGTASAGSIGSGGGDSTIANDEVWLVPAMRRSVLVNRARRNTLIDEH